MDDGAKKGERSLIRPRHKQTLITIKKAYVDDKMIPVVKFLNSFDWITTFHSCEGEPGSTKPYVTFCCDNQKDLYHIVEMFTVKNLNNFFIQMELDVFQAKIRYTVKFKDQEHLKRISEKILKSNKGLS